MDLRSYIDTWPFMSPRARVDPSLFRSTEVTGSAIRMADSFCLHCEKKEVDLKLVFSTEISYSKTQGIIVSVAILGHNSFENRLGFVKNSM